MKKTPPKDPLWFKDAVIYEAHVKAFFDTTNDGIGDFHGLTTKLDYLHDLGINCVWLLPFYPSPLKDDGYDISDYYDINSAYGTLNDFKEFVREAHRRGIRVITELVLNHTSDQHPWFQEARKAPPGSSTRNFYVWSDTPKKYENVRIIFSDTEPSNWTWDPVAKAYYWHRFFHHQPDLNFDNPAVLREIMKVLRFWLDIGVDGFRLDAIPYLVEREGTDCANLAETHGILKEIRRQIDLNYPDRMLLAEANMWPPDVVSYFANGDECHMAFHFPLMPRIYMALRQEDRHPITDILRQTPEIPDNCQWALFLRNHDELTLEMVTDEERDYMYNAYASDTRSRLNLGIRRRLAPLMENSRRRMELLISLLFSFRGTPVIYYGDEIGMGDNIYLGDRNGVRTPMQWSNDRNGGFSRADFARLYSPPIMDPVYGYQAINVEAQQRDPSSLLSWMKRMITLRARYRTFGRGTIEFLYPTNRKVLAYIRRYQDDCILCVANLSRYVQPVELDLSQLKGHTPVEMIGQTPFPTIGDAPYFLTLGPHNFFWFHLTQVPEIARPPLEPVSPEAEEALPVLSFSVPAKEFVQRNARIMENQVLPPYLRKQPWFSGPYRKIQNVLIKDWIMDESGTPLLILFVEVKFARGPGETYVLPLCIRENSGSEPDQPLARIRGLETEFVLSEALADEVGARRLLDWLRSNSTLQTEQGEIKIKLFEAENIDEAFRIGDPHQDRFQIAAMHSDRTVSTFGARLLLKLYRKLEEGASPEQEALKHLAAVKFDRVLRILAAVEYKQKSEASTVLIAERLVSHQGNAWDFTLDELGRYYERALIARKEILSASENASMFSLIGEKPSHHLADVIGDYLHTAAQLGRRTAELHLALAQANDDPQFQTQIMKTSDYDELVKQLKSHSEEAFEELKAAYKKLSRGARERSQIILRSRKDLISQFEDLRTWKLPLHKIRVHGSYDLGKLLWIKNDFLIMDFEGESGKSLEERRKLHSPLKDVAFMLRSFRYAAYTALNQFTETRRQAYNQLEAWANCWQRWISAEFMHEYRIIIGRSPLIPRRIIDFEKLTKLYIADKTLYELEYELAQRPDWIKIPLNGLLELGISVEKA